MTLKSFNLEKENTMSKNGKLYFINLDTYKSLSAQVSKLPKQQQQILATMAEHCVDVGMKGSDIVDLAKKAGLETRQKSTVLYAWYARSNESFGVSTNPPKPAETVTIPAETKVEPASVRKSK